MKFIKNHKFEFIILTIALIVIIVFGVFFIKMWFEENEDVYGDRLKGIEKVELSDGYIKDIFELIKKDRTYVENVSYSLEGKLLSFIVEVTNGTDVELSKTLVTSITDNLKEEELAFYDIQVYIKEKEEKEDSRYPIIGYKHKTSEVFVWSNN